MNDMRESFSCLYFYQALVQKASGQTAKLQAIFPTAEKCTYKLMHGVSNKKIYPYHIHIILLLPVAQLRPIATFWRLRVESPHITQTEPSGICISHYFEEPEEINLNFVLHVWVPRGHAVELGLRRWHVRKGFRLVIAL